MARSTFSTATASSVTTISPSPTIGSAQSRYLGAPPGCSTTAAFTSSLRSLTVLESGDCLTPLERVGKRDGDDVRLNRERVIDEALQLVDEEGLDRLSLRS